MNIKVGSIDDIPKEHATMSVCIVKEFPLIERAFPEIHD